MNTAGVVLWCILIGGAFVFVNGLGMWATALVSPGAPSVTQLAPNLAPCGKSSAGLPLNCNTNAPTDIVGAGFYSLGYFLGAFLQAIPLMVQGALVPGSIASLYFGSGIGEVVNAGMFFLIAMWTWAFVANRQGHLTEAE